ncbi:splicing factor u2af large subunit [Zalerion maritima]|uniref:Splicing factor U2AF subunit n=1 Tax=Zalerion maritima TaxID=339359 RepID=A0AAD5WR91_9PEZI|nr:splicing factor u2af large subunit [Zalerion maritima]
MLTLLQLTGGRHGSYRDYPVRNPDATTSSQPNENSRQSQSARRERDETRDRERERRRSRSPDHGRGGRPRRDGDSDVYSSSRSHREKQREDRYSGRRDRGGDREWDRPPRRDRRDDDDDYRSHRRGRDRDHEGSRGGRRDHDRERDVNAGARERRRSPSPPPAKREPTPDLTNIISVLERKRRMTQWDIKPPGYENVTAEQAKLSGMFPLPGAPRQQPMDPSKLQAFINPGGSGGGGGGGGGSNSNNRDGNASSSNNTALKPTNSRQSKRLVVSNFTPNTTKDNLLQFFNLQLNGLNVIESTDPCITCQVSHDSTFAILEFKTSTDTTVAMALDGTCMEAGGPMLTIKRPKDYVVPAIVDDTLYEPGKVSSVVLDTPNKLCVSNIPVYLTDEQVTELLLSFGQLKSFVLVKDNSTEESRGIAFLEFSDPSSTDVAISGLNDLPVGDSKLKATKASIGITQVAGVENGVSAMSMLASTTVPNSDVTRVLSLLNMVTPEELMDDEDFAEICEDVRDECSKFGAIADMKVPRPIGATRQSAGVGKIFVKYEEAESATKALRALAGRKFADRTVVTTYFPEENFEVEAW